MRRFLQFIGTMVFFCAWPAFWVYFKVGHGRTRVVVVHEGKVLVMKQWVSPGKWNLPGGGVHKGEDVKVGATREVREETSLELDPRQLSLVGSSMYRHYGLSFGFTVYGTRVGSASVRAQRIEISELAWLRPEELHPKNASPDALTALEMVRSNTGLLQ